MISAGQLAGFVLASLVLIVIPGPGVLFVVGRALAHGRRTALATACGHGIGNYVVAACVAVGLGSLLQRSVSVFEVVKLAGALYLVWLGVQAVRHRKSLADAFAASAVRNWFASSPRRFELVGGAGGLAMIGLGVAVAVTGRPSR